MKNRFLALGSFLFCLSFAASFIVAFAESLSNSGLLLFVIFPLISLSFAIVGLRRGEHKRWGIVLVAASAVFLLLLAAGLLRNLDDSVPLPAACYTAESFSCHNASLTRTTDGAQLRVLLQNLQPLPVSFSLPAGSATAPGLTDGPVECLAFPAEVPSAGFVEVTCNLSGNFPAQQVKVLVGLTAGEQVIPIEVRAMAQ